MSTVEEQTTVSIATVVYDDDSTVVLDTSRPLVMLQASKLESANVLEAGFNLLWVAAGKPEGSLEQWLAKVKKVEMGEADPTSAVPTE